MSKRTKGSGNTKEQLTIPGMESLLSSAGSGDSRQALGKNTHDPSWDLTKHS